MSLNYAVDRLYEVGWTPSGTEIQTLPDGRVYPTVNGVKKEFSDAGLSLSLKQTPKFNCVQATWKSGTVVGTSEAEAAVYALAQLLSSGEAMAV
jgi:hypothetical protein